jgi:hypothetical protein
MHSRNDVEKEEFMAYFDLLTDDGKTFKGNDTGEIALSVSSHHFVLSFKENVLQVLEDSYTDASPQDNPQGVDVVEWQDGHFLRKQFNPTGYPNFQLYQDCIEQHGHNLLYEYDLLYRPH